VSLAHRMARESAHIRASCIEATEFMDLTRKFRVTGVPKTIVNGATEILGALPEDAFVRGVLGLPETDSPPNA
jgi:thioredoxin family protein